MAEGHGAWERGMGWRTSEPGLSAGATATPCLADATVVAAVAAAVATVVATVVATRGPGRERRETPLGPGRQRKNARPRRRLHGRCRSGCR